MAAVTNRARSPRVLALADGGRATLAPGQSRDLDLAEHPVHTSWIANGTLTVSAPELPTPPPLPIEETVHERQHQHVGDRSPKRR